MLDLPHDVLRFLLIPMLTTESLITAARINKNWRKAVRDYLRRYPEQIIKLNLVKLEDTSGITGRISEVEPEDNISLDRITEHIKSKFADCIRSSIVECNGITHRRQFDTYSLMLNAEYCTAKPSYTFTDHGFILRIRYSINFWMSERPADNVQIARCDYNIAAYYHTAKGVIYIKLKFKLIPMQNLRWLNPALKFDYIRDLNRDMGKLLISTFDGLLRSFTRHKVIWT